MVQAGIFVVIGVIVVSMAAAMYMYTEYQTNYIIVKEGETVSVGPVEYAISFDGTHKGNKANMPENIFLKIRIIAKNLSDERTNMSGGQFYLVDEKEQRHQPTYGGFSADDLLNVWLEPNKPVMVTTQFDVAYDEGKKYSVVIRPTKQQSTTDTALVCIINC